MQSCYYAVLRTEKRCGECSGSSFLPAAVARLSGKAGALPDYANVRGRPAPRGAGDGGRLRPLSYVCGFSAAGEQREKLTFPLWISLWEGGRVLQPLAEGELKWGLFQPRILARGATAQKSNCRQGRVPLHCTHSAGLCWTGTVPGQKEDGTGA